MKSTVLIAAKYGPSDVLEYETTELPKLSVGMARIKVKSSGLNPIDARRMTGEFRMAPLPQTFGTEFAGVIEEIDPNNGNWLIGDEVLGSGGAFTHATVIDVPIGNLIAKPASIDWTVAGTLAGVSQTAMTILDAIGHVDSLLIHGGSGGVGSITIQLAVKKGIKVVATASAKNLEYLQSLGAIAVAYGSGLIDRLKAVHATSFDASIDMVGTDEATQVSIKSVKPNGFIGSISGKPLAPQVKAVWVKRNPSNLKYVVGGIAAGLLKWNIDKSYPFEEATAAYTNLLDGHTRGKSVLIF
jgi:NADPH2:quinone reductase